MVVTGAMRPPSAVGTDADLNLLDAIRLAASPEAAGRGVLTILNNEIQSARDVTKSNAFRVDTFHSRDFGVLGYVDSDARVLFYRSVTRAHTTATPFDVRGRKDLPRVDIVYAYAGADGLLVDALTERRPAGMVLVGFGGGSFPAAFLDAGKRAVKAGIPVVLATRSWNGRVVSTPKKDADGFIVCDDLMPQKARILLMLALTVTRERRRFRRCSTRLTLRRPREGGDPVCFFRNMGPRLRGATIKAMRKVKKEVIDVPGVSRHLKKEGIPLNPVIRAGNFVFVSGLTPMDRRTGKIPLVTVDKQTRMVLENMKVCLKAAGSSFDNVVKCTVYITNTAYFDEVNKVYRKYFKRNQPARVFCVVGSWPKKFDVEIDCIAVVDE